MEKKSPTVTGAQPRRSSQVQLTDDHICYVLITCRAASKNGEMEVEMTYDGDRILAAYLIETAQGILDK